MQDREIPVDERHRDTEPFWSVMPWQEEEEQEEQEEEEQEE